MREEQALPRTEKEETADVVVVTLVQNDLYQRMEKGIKTYGRPLHPFNGRDALWDAYEEVLDLACYLRQAIYEKEYSNQLKGQLAFQYTKPDLETQKKESEKLQKEYNEWLKFRTERKYIE